MSEKFLNNFSGGRNSDLSADKTPPNQYLSALNVELVGDGEFLSLRNIKGTTNVKALDANIQVLAVFANKYLISSVLVDCLTVFSVSSTTFKIQAYNTSNGTLYDLFSETIGAGYITADRTVDAVNFPENGIDVIYFTDFYNELRYIKCEIPSPYSANFLSAYDISLLRKGANGIITATVASGGTLLSGTYQFAYRMADPTNKRFTKWSSITNPIHVYSAANSTAPVYSGVGLITDRSVILSITTSSEEASEFSYIQLAVIENTGPTPAITASLLEIRAIVGGILTYDYKSNSQIDTIPLEDITVDLAQIKKAKTLAVKDNRLFAGNVHYTSLLFDNGTPAITSGSIITSASDIDSFSSDNFASNYKGYWRGEVYRFGVVYYDKNGNRSSVQPLNLNSTLVPTNAISSGLTDLKFPDRTNSTYTIFNSAGQIQSLGLRLTGLNNHPSWARSLEIVRVDRKGRFKNILFQTPIIPMVRVYGTGAFEKYPTHITYNGAGNDREVTDTTPMTSGYTLVPKNLFWPENRSILKSTSSGGTGINTLVPGEAKLNRTYGGSYEFSMIFPPDSMYNPTKPNVFGGSEKLDFIDYGLVKLNRSEYNVTGKGVVNGDDFNTNISGTFHALSNPQYYYHNGHAKASLSSSYKDKPIVDVAAFDNLGQPGTVSGVSALDYNAFQTGGITLGLAPSTQRSAVIRVSEVSLKDVTETPLTFSAATWNGTSNAGALTSASATLKFEADNAVSNKYVSDYATFSNGNSYVSVIGIGNVKLGLSDNRYGESTDLHEYISTGTRYTFTAAEVTTLEGGGDVVLGNLDVWGGDCFVGPHVFKVCDSTYSVINQTKHNGAADSTSNLCVKWNNTLFKSLSGASILCLPVALEGVSQFVQVVLESEYNGEVRESDILTGSAASVPVMTADGSAARTPLTYKYNINLSKNNDQKIFVPKPQYSFEQNEYGSRVIYSDLKIYNSDVAGFDIFRVGNIYDIEERFRPITKLALAGNQLYSIHENGVVYLPTGEQQLEKSDAGTLAVRSGEVIGKHLIVDSERGCQHQRSIIETGNVIYLADNRNKNVYVLNGQQLQSITKDNETIFRSMFSSKIDGKYLVGVYDAVKGEYWIANADPNATSVHCHVFNEKLGAWVSNYSMGKTLRGYGMANQTLYLVGANGTATSIYTAYTGAVNQLFDQAVSSYVQVSVNPHPGNSKKYDNIKVDASERISGADFVVVRESSLGNQTCSVGLNIDPREGNYRAKVLRDASNARLVGMYCLITLNYGSTQSSLRSITPIYRLSAKYR